MHSSLFFFADSRYLPGSKDGKKSKSSKSGKAKGLAFTLLHRLEMDIQIMIDQHDRPAGVCGLELSAGIRNSF